MRKLLVILLASLPLLGHADESQRAILRTIILLSQFDRIHKQQSHLDRYGVYSIAP